VKVEPENEAWRISLAYSVRWVESVEKAEAILLRAQAIDPDNPLIAFNLAVGYHSRIRSANISMYSYLGF